MRKSEERGRTAGRGVAHSLARRGGGLPVARGAVRANGHELCEGDGAALAEERTIRMGGVAAAELLVFDLP
ncbi:hypothetical protein [Methylacidimicrobium sp. B4]|uniref:pirin family protein n=1 Tax=Methylacidimicrobium sp. B4 TaxID=2796139 RepID=UPI00210475BB|nr:hypothetical protein [Methylacidimicrobium sp. B4]